MMTKKDFVAIAEIIKKNSSKVYGATFTDVTREVVNDLADYFEAQNPNFDRDRFIKACNGY